MHTKAANLAQMFHLSFQLHKTLSFQPGFIFFSSSASVWGLDSLPVTLPFPAGAQVTALFQGFNSWLAANFGGMWPTDVWKSLHIRIINWKTQANTHIAHMGRMRMSSILGLRWAIYAKTAQKRVRAGREKMWNNVTIGNTHKMLK